MLSGIVLCRHSSYNINDMSKGGKVRWFELKLGLNVSTPLDPHAKIWGVGMVDQTMIVVRQFGPVRRLIGDISSLEGTD